MSKDAYYTPEWLAETVVSLSRKRRPRVVADFAAGDGALLRAAEMRWKRATLVAADLCGESVRRLRQRNEQWQCTKCDFLDAHSRARSRVLASLVGSVDQILLNPPFSCRGGTAFSAETPSGVIKCGRAMAFVLASLKYLSPDGVLIAVLPSNVLGSQKDREALLHLQSAYNLSTRIADSSSDFTGCRVKYVLASLTSRKAKLEVKARAAGRRVSGGRRSARVAIVRGTTQMHALPANGRTLVHTTDLRDHRVFLNGHCGGSDRPSAIGPAVLFPRVGALRLDKACLYLRRQRVALSDCVICVQCDSAEDARWLLARFRENQSVYAGMFSGTCAPYATLKRVKAALNLLGCRVE